MVGRNFPGVVILFSQWIQIEIIIAFIIHDGSASDKHPHGSCGSHDARHYLRQEKLLPVRRCTVKRDNRFR